MRNGERKDVHSTIFVHVVRLEFNDNMYNLWCEQHMAISLVAGIRAIKPPYLSVIAQLRASVRACVKFITSS